MKEYKEWNKTSFETLIDHPPQFVEEHDELMREDPRGDDGAAWAKLLYEDWFICPRKNLGDHLEVMITPKRACHKPGRVSKPNEIGIHVSNADLIRSEDDDDGHSPVYVPLDLIIREAVRLEREFGGEKEASKLIDLIEKTVSKALLAARKENGEGLSRRAKKKGGKR